jgi:hypothetical protein
LFEYPFKKVPGLVQERRRHPIVFSIRNDDRRKRHEENIYSSRRVSDHRGCGAVSGERAGL